MIPASSVRFLGWDNDLLLLVHLHTHQRVVKTLNHLTRSQHHHQRVVVASRILKSRALGFRLHGRVEYLSTGEFSDIVDRDGVSFLCFQFYAHNRHPSESILGLKIGDGWRFR